MGCRVKYMSGVYDPAKTCAAVIRSNITEALLCGGSAFYLKDDHDVMDAVPLTTHTTLRLVTPLTNEFLINVTGWSAIFSSLHLSQSLLQSGRGDGGAWGYRDPDDWAGMIGLGVLGMLPY